jgi:hypothetical protein
MEMLRELFSIGYSNAVRVAEAITSSSWWKIKVTVLAVACGLFFSFPSLDVFFDGRYLESWSPVLIKVQEPLTDLVREHGYSENSHASKLNFRILVPMVSYFFKFGVYEITAMAFVGGVLLVWLSVQLSYMITKDRVVPLFMALLLVGIHAGMTSFGEFRGMFDGISLLLLVASMVTRNPVCIFMFVFMACWNDERSLLSAGLVLLFHAMSVQKEGDKLTIRSFFSSSCISVALAVIAYIGSRLWLANNYSISTTWGGVGISILLEQVNNLPMGIWTAFEGGWLLILTAFILLYAHKDWLAMVVFGGMMSILIVGSVSVVDITRSMAYLLPSIFIALLLLQRSLSVDELRVLTVVSGISCLLWPTYYAGGQKSIWWSYPLPIQLVRWILM